MKPVESRKVDLAIRLISIDSRLSRPAPAFPCSLFFLPWLLFCALVMLQASYAAESVRLEKIAEIKLRSAPVAVDWSRDGRFMAVGGWRGSLAIWDTKSESVVLNQTFGRLRFVALKFSPDGRVLAVGRDLSGQESPIWLFDIRTWEKRDAASARLLGRAESLCFTHDGRRLAAAVGIPGKEPFLLDAEGDAAPIRFQTILGNHSVSHVACHPSQPVVAMERTMALIETFDAIKGARMGTEQAYDPDWWWIQEVEFSQDGRFLFTGSNSGMTVEKLNRKTGKMEKKDRGEPIKMWDSSTLKLLRMFGDQKDGETFLKSSVRSLSHSARDGLLLAGFDGGKIRAWDVETGEERLSRSGWRSAVIAKFSHDGSRLAVADQGSHSVTIFKILDAR